MFYTVIYKLFLRLSLCLDAEVCLKCFVFIFPSRSVVLRDKKKLTNLSVIAVDMTHIPSSCHHLSAASRPDSASFFHPLFELFAPFLSY